jgi:hypothetical protein
MVLDVPVYFVLNAVEAVGDDSVIDVLSFEASMNKSNNNTEQPSNDNSQ